MNKRKRAVSRTNSKKSNSEFQHGSFWVLLAIVFFLTVLTVFKSIEQSTLTGHATIQTISFMKGGQEFNFEVPDIPGVREVTIQLKEDVKNSKIIFKEDNDIKFTGNFFSKFIASSVDKEKYGNLEFLLKIKERDLLEKGIAIYDVRLYANGRELPTTLTKIVGEYLFYTATSPEMGEFVIGRVMPKELAEEITTNVNVAGEAAVGESQPAATTGEETIGEDKTSETGEPLAGKAAEQALPQEEGIIAKIISFFKNLFN